MNYSTKTNDYLVKLSATLEEAIAEEVGSATLDMIYDYVEIERELVLRENA